MASKIKETYVCAECGAKSPLWRGQCLVCKAWNSLELVAAPVEGARKRPIGSLGSVKAMPLAHVEDHGHEPFGTGLDALDRVLGRALFREAPCSWRRAGHRQVHASVADGRGRGRFGQAGSVRERRRIVAADQGSRQPSGNAA